MHFEITNWKSEMIVQIITCCRKHSSHDSVEESDILPVNRIGGETGDRARLEPRVDQTKDYEMDVWCFSANHTALRRKRKDWLARNQKMYPNGMTCLSADCCFSELALYQSRSSIKRISSSSH